MQSATSQHTVTRRVMCGASHVMLGVYCVSCIKHRVVHRHCQTGVMHMVHTIYTMASCMQTHAPSAHLCTITTATTAAAFVATIITTAFAAKFKVDVNVTHLCPISKQSTSVGA
jgi:hypothetical protein